MRTPFSERAETMGLQAVQEKGLYSYEDQYSKIVYRQLICDSDPTPQPHETDGKQTPILAIYTKSNEPNDEFKYCGYVSELYQFIGNDVLNQNIRESLQQVGMPIVSENPLVFSDYTRMRTEITIQSSQNVPQVGDVFPVMIVNNSYNGTKAASVAFGIATYYGQERVIFSFNLGEIKQVHLVNTSTQMRTAATTYIQTFTENITDMISQSFQSQLTEEQMLGTLDLIENIGKKKREEISKLLIEMNPPATEGAPAPLPSAWQMFLAIVRYSSLEPNLNVKKLLESAAESVLVIPPRMFDVLEQLQNQ